MKKSIAVALFLGFIQSANAGIINAWTVTADGTVTNYGNAYSTLDFTLDGAYWGVRANQMYLNGDLVNTPSLTGTIIDIEARDPGLTWAFTEEGDVWGVRADGSATNYGSTSWSDLEWTNMGYWGVRDNQLYNNDGLVNTPSLTGTIVEIEAPHNQTVWAFTEEGDAWVVRADGSATNYGSLWSDLEFTNFGYWGVRDNQLYNSNIGTFINTPSLTGTIVNIAAHDQSVAWVFTETTDVPEPTTLALMSLGLVGLGFAWRKKAA